MTNAGQSSGRRGNGRRDGTRPGPRQRSASAVERFRLRGTLTGTLFLLALPLAVTLAVLAFHTYVVFGPARTAEPLDSQVLMSVTVGAALLATVPLLRYTRLVTFVLCLISMVLGLTTLGFAVEDAGMARHGVLTTCTVAGSAQREEAEQSGRGSRTVTFQDYSLDCADARADELTLREPKPSMAEGDGVEVRFDPGHRIPVQEADGYAMSSPWLFSAAGLGLTVLWLHLATRPKSRFRSRRWRTPGWPRSR